ncbi:MAG: DUF975 family protein [Clostridia bacterium]|nr:DUF975 family protein [Clostridia bacterium]
MLNRKEIKKNSKSRLKKHYKLFFLVMVLAALIGTSFTAPLDEWHFLLNNVKADGEPIGLSRISSIGTDEAYDVFKDIINGNIANGKIKTIERTKENQKNKKVIMGVELGYNRGVLAGAVNSITSGAWYITAYNAIKNLAGSPGIATSIFILLSLLLIALFYIFIEETFRVAMNRVYLEGQFYDVIHINKLVFILKVKKWINVSLGLLLKNIFMFLWIFTIVGPIIKFFSYSMVPYILAENPGVKPLQAIRLSKNMMKGHKWELFKFELSFIGWDLLGYITLGLTDIFFTYNYKECALAEYYAYVRACAKENAVEGCELLKDDYLFELAPLDVVIKAYEDIDDIEDELNEAVDVEYTGVKGFFANVFGVVLHYDENEKRHNDIVEKRAKLRIYRDEVNGLSYPSRLYPVHAKEKISKLETMHYLRRYSLESLIVVFFVLSIVGWLWEVSLHLVADGEFVNRGVNHGPWLPIYGSGVVLIVLVLNKFRDKPWLEFITAVVLCGVVEYFTSWLMEMTKGGVKWWDYTGYFLNINGRVCAEGLLVFGIGGICAVYLLVPLIDNLVRKINPTALTVACIVLIAAFAADTVYSQYYPNTGKGITDYDNAYVIEHNIDVGRVDRS